MKKYDAIVIGGGIGGLGAALLLSQKGKKTLLLEKNNSLGGRLCSFEKEGFTVDLGVHIISQSSKGPLGEVMRRAGLESKLNYTRIRPVTSFDGKIFTFPKDLQTMVPEKDYEGLLAFIDAIKNTPEDEVSSYDGITTKDMLERYTESDLVHACVSNISTIYMCLPSWQSSAGEFMRCFRAEAASRASGYPEGGCGAIVGELAEGIKKYGGEIAVGEGASQIIVENGRVVGVKTDKGEYLADMVVSNADIKQTVLSFAPEAFSEEYKDYVQNLKYSWWGPVLRLALDTEMTDIMMLTQFGSIKQEEYYEELARGIIPSELNLFVVVPSNFSPSVVPEGKQLVVATSPMPLYQPVDYKAIKEAIYNTIEKYIPGIRDHVQWSQYVDEKSMAALVGETGAGIGVGQFPDQVGAKRPNIKTPVEGLYIVGAEAGGYGVGIELALNSVLEFDDQYL